MKFFDKHRSTLSLNVNSKVGDTMIVRWFSIVEKKSSEFSVDGSIFESSPFESDRWKYKEFFSEILFLRRRSSTQQKSCWELKETNLERLLKFDVFQLFSDWVTSVW